MKRWIGYASGVALLIVGSFVAHYNILLMGECERPNEVRTSRIRGQVVGKRLYTLQYRWLRRLFIPQGTKLSLSRQLPHTEYEGNVILHREPMGIRTIGPSGQFDFGYLPPATYDLSVKHPDEDTFLTEVTLAPEATSAEMLIDASPAYYCGCCGWQVEVR